MILGGVELLVAEGVIGEIQQLGAQLCIADPAAVFRDQGQQGIGEVGANGHREAGPSEAVKQRLLRWGGVWQSSAVSPCWP